MKWAASIFLPFPLSFLPILFLRHGGESAMPGLTLSLLFSIFFLISFVLILVTIGLAAICTQPLMILATPLMFLMTGFLEAANTAVVADEMNAMDAIRHARQIVRANIWKSVLITLIAYLGTSIFTGFIMAPFMLPVFAVPFLMDGSDSGAQLMIEAVVVYAGAFFALMILLSSFTGPYLKAAPDPGGGSAPGRSQ